MMITLSILVPAANRNPAVSFLRLVADCGRRFACFCERREAIRILQGLDDHQLRDLGISRCRIEQAVHGRTPPRQRWEMNR